MIQAIVAREAQKLATEVVLNEVKEEVSKKALSEGSLKLLPKELLSKSDEVGIIFKDGMLENMEKDIVTKNYQDALNNGDLDTLNQTYIEKIQLDKESFINHKFSGMDKDGVSFSEYGFPEFDSKFETTIPLENFNAGRGKHNKLANEQLKGELDKNSILMDNFSDRQIAQINSDLTPEGFTWHHDGNPPPGRMQLVATIQHDLVRHHGGFSQWKTI